MRFDPLRAEIRFGCGLSPSLEPPRDVDAMLAKLRGPDVAAQRFPIAGLDVVLTAAQEIRAARRKVRKAKDEAMQDAANAAARAARRAVRDDAAIWVRHVLLRRALTEDGMRERLAHFWADHFTAQGRNSILRLGYLPYVEDAIRPHVAGRFADMLKAAVMNPLMLIYLDQHLSIGPGSEIAQRRKSNAGLNENMAREVIELHTLGVDGPYTQDDVRVLAELLTGLSVERGRGFVFRPEMAEPGEKTLFGQRYRGALSLERVEAVLEDLAAHPATAAHLASKVATHFVGDAPDPDMVAMMTAAYLAEGGALMPVYEAMLRHPGAWHAGPGNVKQPIDFVTSALRALDIVPRHVPASERKLRRHVLEPMVLMGQAWGAPNGPDGWPEADTAWITPQRMAARLQWAMTVPFALKRLLPDPRSFVDTALGPDAPEAVRFAASAAETRAEGVGLVLASPAFHRM